jgi:hypothetical protein
MLTELAGQTEDAEEITVVERQFVPRPTSTAEVSLPLQRLRGDGAGPLRWQRAPMSAVLATRPSLRSTWP